MKILLTGSSGFVGGAILGLLLRAGHEVIAPLRSAAERPARAGLSYREFDFMHPPEPAGLVELMRDVEVVINAVGIIRETKDATFQRLHVDTPLALFAAAQAQRVQRIVQISAVGTSEESPFEYFRSKAQVERFLRTTCKVPSLILRPSLVYGEKGEATVLFKQLANLPLVPLPAGGEFFFHPILVEDLAQLVLDALGLAPLSTQAVDVGGAERMSLKEILLALRAAKRGTSPESGPTLAVPRWLMKPAAWFGDVTGSGPLTSDMLEMLVTSEAPDLTSMSRLFQFRPRGLAAYLRQSHDG